MVPGRVFLFKLEDIQRLMVKYPGQARPHELKPFYLPEFLLAKVRDYVIEQIPIDWADVLSEVPCAPLMPALAPVVQPAQRYYDDCKHTLGTGTVESDGSATNIPPDATSAPAAESSVELITPMQLENNHVAAAGVPVDDEEEQSSSCSSSDDDDSSDDDSSDDEAASPASGNTAAPIEQTAEVARFTARPLISRMPVATRTPTPTPITTEASTPSALSQASDSNAAASKSMPPPISFAAVTPKRSPLPSGCVSQVSGSRQSVRQKIRKQAIVDPGTRANEPDSSSPRPMPTMTLLSNGARAPHSTPTAISMLTM